MVNISREQAARMVGEGSTGGGGGGERERERERETDLACSSVSI